MRMTGPKSKYLYPPSGTLFHAWTTNGGYPSYFTIVPRGDTSRGQTTTSKSGVCTTTSKIVMRSWTLDLPSNFAGKNFPKRCDRDRRSTNTDCRSQASPFILGHKTNLRQFLELALVRLSRARGADAHIITGEYEKKAHLASYAPSKKKAVEKNFFVMKKK